MPDAGVELQARVTLLDGLNGGWCRIEPRGTVGLAVLDQHVAEDRAVLVFGDLVGVPTDQTARRIAGVSAEAASDLDGSFGSVIVHRPTGKVSLVTDCIGGRALRYVATDDFILASPHDLTLLASGLVDLSLDLVSAASMATAGWSLNGRSLLKDVATSRPDERVHWQGGALAHEDVPLLVSDRRIDARDQKRIQEQLGAMADVAREGARAFAERWPQTGIQLTAGVDSRAALAAILPSLDRERTFVQTTGYPDSPDVRTARRLAGHYGLRFRLTEPQVPSPEGFMRTVDLFAFSMNGDTNAKRAPQVNRTYAERANALSWGGTGGIYRGIYYRASDGRPLGSEGALEKVYDKNFRRKLVFDDPQITERLHRRIAETVHHYASFSSNGYDILDLYSVHEYFSVWDAIKDRFTWTPTAFWTPFKDRRMLRLGFELPAPIGKYAHIHRTLIRQSLPWAYWVRVNHETLLPLHSSPLLARVDRRLRAVTGKIKSRIAPDGSRHESKGHEQAQADMFAGPLAAPIRDELTRTDSLSVALLGRQAAEQLMQEHIKGVRNHAQVIGRLVTAERWLHLARAFAASPEAGPVRN